MSILKKSTIKKAFKQISDICKRIDINFVERSQMKISKKYEN
jgi:hypothetical protein